MALLFGVNKFGCPFFDSLFGQNVRALFPCHVPVRHGLCRHQAPQIAIPATTLYRVCMVCNEPSRLRCSQCKRAFYCNACCQEQDWPAHSEVCEHWSASFGSLLTCTHIDKQTSFVLECAPSMSSSSCASSIAKKKLSWK